MKLPITAVYLVEPEVQSINETGVGMEAGIIETTETLEILPIPDLIYSPQPLSDTKRDLSQKPGTNNRNIGTTGTLPT